MWYILCLIYKVHLIIAISSEVRIRHRIQMTCKYATCLPLVSEVSVFSLNPYRSFFSCYLFCSDSAYNSPQGHSAYNDTLVKKIQKCPDTIKHLPQFHVLCTFVLMLLCYPSTFQLKSFNNSFIDQLRLMMGKINSFLYSFSWAGCSTCL